jgi:hypothetical protein
VSVVAVFIAAVRNVVVSDCGLDGWLAGCTTAKFIVRAYRVTYVMSSGVAGDRGRLVVGHTDSRRSGW